MMNKPRLVETYPSGYTIHTYDIEGGKTTFHHYLLCLDGTCNFYNTLEEAQEVLNFDINL